MLYRLGRETGIGCSLNSSASESVMLGTRAIEGDARDRCNKRKHLRARGDLLPSAPCSTLNSGDVSAAFLSAVAHPHSNSHPAIDP